MRDIELYEYDLSAWIYRQISLLKAGETSKIDVEHLIEELEGMAKRDRNELTSHLVILIAHLLNWECQLEQLTETWEQFTGKSWHNSILEQRYRIKDQLENIPSLQTYVSEAIVKAYPKAVALAVDETNLPKQTFPQNCPYSVAQLLDKTFYPTSSV